MRFPVWSTKVKAFLDLCKAFDIFMEKPERYESNVPHIKWIKARPTSVSQVITIQHAAPNSRAAGQVLQRGIEPRSNAGVSDLEEEKPALAVFVDDVETERGIRNENDKYGVMWPSRKERCKTAVSAVGSGSALQPHRSVQQNRAREPEVIAPRWGRAFLKGEAIRCQSNLDKIQVVMDALLTII